jgi:hypothetical protein
MARALLEYPHSSRCRGYTPTQEFRFERMDPPNLNKHPAYSQDTTVSGTVDRPLDYKPGSNRCEHGDWAGQYRSHIGRCPSPASS